MTFESTATNLVQVGEVIPTAGSLWAVSPVTVGAAVSVRHHGSGCTGTALYNIVWWCEGAYCSATTAHTWVESVNLE